ncbi:ATP-binding protein [Desulfogranum mediterraneum]|uniref:ATP-binding protein n=1 Tax=Desulfogranum mediterraneum TaxID=160661 RepID=UPI00041D1F9F|nr:4Fe-4S binding protein [Desulfogranum mediterraneum]
MPGCRTFIRRFPSSATRAFIREARRTPGYSLFNWIHGYVYGRWIYLYIGIGTGSHPLARLLRPLLRPLAVLKKRCQPGSAVSSSPTFSDTYHGKVIPLDQARKIVTVNREIRIHDLEQVIPYSLARSLILKNPEHIVVLDCPCRAARSAPCLPLDVCLIIGEPFASFTREHHPQRSRAITMKQALIILEEEHQRGHVHHAFFKQAMLNRFYAICNCCSCCCGAIQAWNHKTPMLASSGYLARVDEERCLGCGSCVPCCQFEALTRTAEKVEVDEQRCLGCGVCVDHCPTAAITLLLSPEKGVPLEVERL